MGEKWNFEGGVEFKRRDPASYIILTSPKFTVVVQVLSLF